MAYVATDATAYERSMGRWSRALAEPFLDACALPAGARVLDAGCGTGALAEALLARDAAARVTGIDVAEPFLATARQRVPGTGFRRAYRAGSPDGPRSFVAIARLATGRVPAAPSAP